MKNTYNVFLLTSLFLEDSDSSSDIEIEPLKLIKRKDKKEKKDKDKNKNKGSKIKVKHKIVKKKNKGQKRELSENTNAHDFPNRKQIKKKTKTRVLKLKENSPIKLNEEKLEFTLKDTCEKIEILKNIWKKYYERLENVCMITATCNILLNNLSYIQQLYQLYSHTPYIIFDEV